ncbi:MAG TPA: lipoxygenase family protein [Thermoanaerobaculia bacterium]
MVTLRDIVSDVLSCLGPLRACDDAVQTYVAEPLQAYVVDPTINYCIDPVRHALAINPCGCIPGCGSVPTLPQYDSPSQQDIRDAQVGRAKSLYQYNYTLVRTFREGRQGEGIAILDSVPMAQLPSLWWVCIVLQQAIIVLDNLLLVLELMAEGSPRDQAAMAVSDANRVDGDEELDEPDLKTVACDLSPEQLDDHRNEVQALRANLLGSLVWGRSVTDGLRRDDDPYDPAADAYDRPLRSKVPPHERSSPGGSSCSCLRCSPQAITRDAVENIKHALGEVVRRIMLLPGLDRHPYSIKAYNDLFQRIPLPDFALWFQNDDMFALQRVAGQNPVVLERIEWTDEWSSRFPLTNRQYREVMGEDDSLTEAGEDGRLYLCDYQKTLRWVEAGDFPPFAGQKYINAPYALFALTKEDRCVIKAVAIQVGPQPGPDNPIFTPPNGADDPRRWNWEIAKTIVQNADCNDSEFYRHLGCGHLLTEAFILATYRSLPREHPLYVLLTPNFQGTLFTNDTAVTSINVEHSYLNITEMIFSGTVPSTLGIAGNAVHDIDYNESMLPNDLRRRGVDDPELLPNYPFRDDALLVRDAIFRWVQDYVALYYQEDCDVTGDYELQNWAREVSSQNGGRIKGVGDVADGRIETREYLVDVMTEVIYVASAHHALTNFPLHEYEIYEPGWPGALYQPPPASDSGATRMDWLSYLAKLNIAVLQQALGFLVGSTYFTRLGYYPVCHFNDPRVAEPLNEFQRDLDAIERIINERNATRVLRYPFLLPSRIPASTNI